MAFDYNNVGLVVFAFVVLFGIMLMRVFYMTDDMGELAASLLINEAEAGSRLDQVASEAAKGYDLCPVCEFENFKGSIFCTVCGEQIVIPSTINTDSDADITHTNSQSNDSCRSPTTSTSVIRPDPFLMELRAQSVGLSTSGNRRQTRARRRKEWTRKLDVEGNIYWFRDRTAIGDRVVAGVCASYMTTTQLRQLSQRNKRKVDPMESSSIENITSMEYNVSVMKEDNKENIPTERDEKLPIVYEVVKTPKAAITSEDSPRIYSFAKITQPDNVWLPPSVGAMLEKMTNTKRLVILEAKDFDASQIPTACCDEQLPQGSIQTMKDKNEFLAMASRDFPTKYAHFVASSSALMVPADVEFLKLSVHREYILEESMEHICCLEKKHLHNVIRIAFLSESGIDAGGLQREWFMLMNDTMVNPKIGLFNCINEADMTYFINPNSREDCGEDHLIYYYATGRLLGRALIEGLVLNFHLAIPLLKLILGIPLTLEDMDYIDPQTYKSMIWMIQNDGVDALTLDFTITEERSTSSNPVVVELCPNGKNISVTDDNKLKYLELKFKYMLLASVGEQLQALISGIYEVLPSQLLLLFDHEELDFLLCGTQNIDVDDWQKNSIASPNLEGTQTLKWFWEVVAEMPNEYKRRLLQFTTGCSRVPLVGFKGLTSYDGRLCLFTVKGLIYTKPQYIRSHACFNRIDIPFYSSKDRLREVLMLTLDTELYGFNTE